MYCPHCWVVPVFGSICPQLNKTFQVLCWVGVIKYGLLFVAYCDSGQEKINDSCEDCQIGYFKDNVNDGLFAACQVCPIDRITNGTGSTSQNDCNIGECSNSYSKSCFLSLGSWFETSCLLIINILQVLDNQTWHSLTLLTWCYIHHITFCTLLSS